MQIDPKRLHSLRQKKGLSRPQLAKQSGITEKTIQRLEKEPQPSQKKTLNRLAKALRVEPEVLTGELPLPESDKAPDPERVQIGAQVAPKVRLAYDLIKRRYGVSATEIINMAPLFFALLAEGSLAWRSEKLKELKEGIDRLEQIDGFWHGQGLPFAVTPSPEAIEAEKDSIAKADLFGEHLLGCVTYDLDPSTDNPFASYLRKLKAELAIPGVVDVNSGDLMFGSPLKFPDHDICLDELDDIANDSTNAKRALATGCARLSEIPEELMAEDAGEERAKWLEERLLDIFKEKEIEDINIQTKKKLKDVLESEKDSDSAIKRTTEILREQGSQLKERFDSNRCAGETARSASLDPEGNLEKRIEEADSQETKSDIEKGGDDQ